jgi:hypothetical protein
MVVVVVNGGVENDLLYLTAENVHAVVLALRRLA